MESYLPVIWALLIGTAVALYVILDGFDLGIGILFPYAKEEKEQDRSGTATRSGSCSAVADCGSRSPTPTRS